MNLIALILGLALERALTRLLHLRSLHWLDGWFRFGAARMRAGPRPLAFLVGLLVVLLPASIGGAGDTATGAAALMMYTPNQLRAQVTALYYFVINILGLTLGPTAVALFTDQVFGDDLALRYSLSIVCALAGAFAIGFLTYNLGLYREAVIEAEAAENEVEAGALTP